MLFPALESLAFVLDSQPEWGRTGRVLFLRAQPHPALECFKGRLTCAQTWKPRATALEAAGYPVTKDPTGSYDLVLLLPERQRETILSDLAQGHDLLAPGGTLMVALHNDWGAKRVEQQLRELAGEAQTVSKHHSRTFWAIKDSARPWNATTLASWRDAAAMRRILDGRFWSAPGIFNWDRIDDGSRLLTDHLPAQLSGAAADLGCGWGYLGDHLLRHCPNLRSLDVYEADAVALECARRNLGLVPSPIRARLHWQDVTTGLGQAKFDVIVTNPPFHEGRDADPLLGMKFIGAAAQGLRSTGQLYLVANKHLPYEHLMEEAFEDSRKVVESGGFKVLFGARPKPLMRGAPRRGRK